jgi:transposase InsO family protein
LVLSEKSAPLCWLYLAVVMDLFARELARADVFDYIEVLYNRTRRHSHLGGIRPEAFERASF